MLIARTKSSLKIGSLILAGFLGLSAAVPAHAQQFQTWKVTSTGSACALQTNTDMQNIPSAYFTLFSEERNTFQLMIRGNVSGGGDPFRTGEVVFSNGRTAPAKNIYYKLNPSSNSLLDDTLDLIVYLDTEYLQDVAKSESFSLRFDGNVNFATYRINERGQAVSYMARCMGSLR